MNIPAFRAAMMRPTPASASHVAAGESGALDEYRPTGPVATPAELPRFAPQEAIEAIAARLEKTWQARLSGQERCTVGIIVERGWKPEGQHDEVLNIADAVMDAGGMPRLLYIGAGEPNAQMRGLHALAVPGGRDIDPSSYGATMGPGMDPNEPDKAFDNFEMACIGQAYQAGLPLIGHCRGFQIMNVTGGGTMTQDIPTEFKTREGFGSSYGTRVDHRPEETRHDYEKRVDPVQLVVVEEGARLAGLVGLLESVNSIHHQCLAAISPLLVPVAFALDGLVEGVERKGMPWQSGYQFHPEALRYTDGRYQGLYQNLVEDGVRFKNGELFVLASQVQVPEGTPETSFARDAAAQRDWLVRQSEQRFGATADQLMQTRVGQAHFESLAEEWRLAHPR
ncbi:gamma-glutamyl-gamma-aminobutyrate hydrolase family protein [bacterium CPR1]|nr:gamma-glutamyl-gamma-aminobutyrate hydrolase family protein [bacterium CPR1]